MILLSSRNAMHRLTEHILCLHLYQMKLLASPVWSALQWLYWEVISHCLEMLRSLRVFQTIGMDVSNSVDNNISWLLTVLLLNDSIMVTMKTVSFSKKSCFLFSYIIWKTLATFMVGYYLFRKKRSQQSNG